MNNLDPKFSFSQSNLSDYETCARRFDLRYRQGLSWPAVESAPLAEAERRMTLGRDFHRLVHQHLLGVPESRLTAMAEASPYPDLAALWANYLADQPAVLQEPQARLFPEVTLFTPLAGFRLQAKFDLLVFLPNAVHIFDWKTATQRPTSNRLRERMQTRVYLYVLTEAGASLNGGQPLDPEAVSMTYWFAQHPSQPERIRYQATQHGLNRTYLRGLIEQIDSTPNFPLTTDERACHYCVYRSYCNRGDAAGPISAQVEEADTFSDTELDLDWEQVAEISY
jgi:hypothetical protein